MTVSVGCSSLQRYANKATAPSPPGSSALPPFPPLRGIYSASLAWQKHAYTAWGRTRDTERQSDVLRHPVDSLISVVTSQEGFEIYISVRIWACSPWDIFSEEHNLDYVCCSQRLPVVLKYRDDIIWLNWWIQKALVVHWGSPKTT